MWYPSVTPKEGSGWVAIVHDDDGTIKASAYVSTQDGSIKTFIEDGWLTPEEARLFGQALLGNLVPFAESGGWDK